LFDLGPGVYKFAFCYGGRRDFMRLGAFLALGLALGGVTSHAAHANLITNGNFATGTLADWTNSDGSIVIDTADAPSPDTYDAAFTGSGTLSQAVATTPGQAYTLSFLLLDEAGYALDTFTVDFGGVSKTITDVLLATYLAESITVPGSDITSSTTTLSFQGTEPSGQDWNLDNVSVVQASVPEPPAGTILAAGALLLFGLNWRGRTSDH
jgi:hypothetical protein